MPAGLAETKKTEVSFEDALKNLEKVVRSLEQGEVPLEQALHLFQEGVGLVKICSAKLEEAEKQVQLLLEEPDGKISLQPAVALGEGA